MTVPLLAALLAVVLPATAQARNPISGKLDKGGLTVIAMARDGRVSQAVAKDNGAFSIVPPASRVTLQLRTADGRYGGPVVIAGGGQRLIVGVHHGVDLGAIHVGGRFARVRTAPPKIKQDGSFVARGRGGVPLGAGVFGRVKVAKSAGGTAAGDDRDGDGVPNALDVDDDGDLVLDTVDDGAPQGALRGQAVVASSLRAPLGASANVDGGAGVSVDVLDEMMKAGGALTLPLQPSGTFELDCGGLVYCTRHTKLAPAADVTPRSAVLAPKAGVRAIRAGDVLVERRKGRALAGTLTFAYVSVPAVAAWADGTSVGPVVYPASDATPGSSGNPLVVHPRGDGHAVLQLAVWRPQRAAFPAEADAFVDLGHLRYSIVVDEAPTAASGGGAGAPDAGPGQCSLASYTENDDNLSGSGTAAHGVLVDAADDLTADPNRTLVFSVDFTTCLAAASLTWKPNQVLTVALRAADAGLGFAEQILTLKLAPAASA